jgi:hypothetical protein
MGWEGLTGNGNPRWATHFFPHPAQVTGRVGGHEVVQSDWNTSSRSPSPKSSWPQAFGQDDRIQPALRNVLGRVTVATPRHLEISGSDGLRGGKPFPPRESRHLLYPKVTSRGNRKTGAVASPVCHSSWSCLMSYHSLTTNVLLCPTAWPDTSH